jgi:hypothetical protein
MILLSNDTGAPEADARSLKRLTKWNMWSTEKYHD